MEQLPIFVFEGPHEVYVSKSLAAAERELEAVDVANGEYELYAADGTRIGATAQGQRVVLTATAESRPNELRQRLRRYLTQPTVGLSPDMAEDPARLALVLLERQRAALWPRWPQWLHRLVHG